VILTSMLGMMHMLSDDSILVLTTRERNWWWSMQEIIPALERVWTAIGQSKGENVRILCLPLEPEVEQRLQACASQPKRIVLTTVTPETERVALLLRLQMKVAAPMIIYLSGDATEGFHSFSTLTNVLTERDVFVVCSEADAVATRCCFPNAQVTVIPFPLVDQFKVNSRERVMRLDAARLAYVGRVSEQKNLHTLLFALWILRTYFGDLPKITLDVYGSVDNLGSPNIGLEFPKYDKYLHDLAEVLGVDDMVTSHGFKSRDWLFDNVHQQPHIFVSPTLHSDENFGSSVLASLVNGHQVVTTAWGGHFGFEDWFSQQLLLVPVYRSTMGPVIDPVMLADAILRSISRMLTIDVEDTTLQRGRAEFSVSKVATRTVELLNKPLGKPVSLKKSPTLQLIDQRRALFGGKRKIYESYEDPVAHIFFEAYGMREMLTFQEQSSYILPPWTSYSDQVLRIDDPHRGHQSFDLDADSSEPFDVKICPSMNTCCLPKSLVKNLLAQGYAFLLPPLDAADGREVPGRWQLRT
jgi:glycosyltransferase involved in cell wall biosynthesis